MSNMIKTISFLFVIVTVLVARTVFADTQPTFEILTPQIFEGEIVQLRAEYDSRGNAYHPTEQPTTWFKFGTHPSNLEFETTRKSRLKGLYEVTQGIAHLQPDTIYYVQAVIKFEGDATHGDILSFNSSILTPVILNDPASVNTTTPSGTTTSSGGTTTTTRNTTTSGGNYINANAPILTLDLLNFPYIFSYRSKKPLLDTSGDRRELITYAERSDFENSATNYDEHGEIIKSTKNTKFATKSVGVTASVNQIGTSYSNGGTNYGILLLIVLMLVVIVIMTRITMRKRWRVIRNTQRNPNVNMRQRPLYNQPISLQSNRPQYQSRYSY